MSELLLTLAAAPGLPLILGAILVPLLPHAPRQVWMLGLVALSGYLSFGQPIEPLHLTLAGLDLNPLRAHPLSLPFSVVFHIAAVLGIVFAMHEDSRMTATAGLAYAGAAIAALYAGDFMSLFIYWEATAVTSVCLVLAGGTPRALSAGMRYLMMQVGSGVILLAGAVLLWRSGEGLAIGPMDALSPAGFLLLAAFGIKAGFPLLNGWLQDAYPEASATGSVMLSAFTTKLAIFMLAVCFAGFTPLIYIGLAMAIVPLFSGVMENNLRRVLAVALNNQLGFMVVGIGIGSELALNGAVAHAFASVLYKGLLFMSLGAVLLRAGSDKADELGGLARAMPLTAAFCLVGAFSIASMPLFSGFTTKALTLGAAAKDGHTLVWLLLLVASVGVMLHTALKLPHAIFFTPKDNIETDEAPSNMLLAMGSAALLCLGVGLFPTTLYALLPYEVSYKVWKAGHVLGELQLLAFATLAYVVLVRRGVLPLHGGRTVLYSDWATRRAIPHILVEFGTPVLQFGKHFGDRCAELARRLLHISEQTSRESGLVSGMVSTGAAAGLFLAVFAVMLLIRLIM